jgi:hypothetical protein
MGLTERPTRVWEIPEPRPDFFPEVPARPDRETVPVAPEPAPEPALAPA